MCVNVNKELCIQIGNFQLNINSTPHTVYIYDIALYICMVCMICIYIPYT